MSIKHYQLRLSGLREIEKKIKATSLRCTIREDADYMTSLVLFVYTKT